jgi:hypothetical protein
MPDETRTKERSAVEQVAGSASRDVVKPGERWGSASLPETDAEVAMRHWIARAFKRGSPELVEEMLKQGIREFDAEAARISRLELKATGMLTAAGLTLTLVTSVGIGVLAAKERLLSGNWLTGFSVAFAVAIAAGAATTGFAMYALRLTATSVPEVKLLLDHAELEKVDNAADRDLGLRDYRAIVGAQIWYCAFRNRATINTKIKAVKWAQFSFVLLVVGIVAIAGLSIGFALLKMRA